MRPHLPTLVAATFLLPAAALCAQETGVSHPEAIEETITTTTATTVTAKPVDAAAPVTARPVLQTRTAETAVITDGSPVVVETKTVATETTPTVLRVAPTEAARREEALGNSLDEGIVASLPYIKNALAEGTMLRARLNQEISSKTTEQGSRFTARLSSEVTHDGRIVFPEGTLLSGRVTSIKQPRKLGGGASVHLEPDTVTLPDGTAYRVNARIIDTDDFHNSRVNDEGTIIHTQHAKATLASLGLTTGSAAVAGAMIGGGVGAAVGAGIGAGIGAAWWLRRDRSETLAEGTQLVFSLDRPLYLVPLTPDAAGAN